MAGIRREMIASEMQRALSDIISREIKDPALPPMCSVTGVVVAADLSVATARVSVLGDKAQLDQAVAALMRAAGFIRKQLSGRMDLRYTPRLTFVGDQSVQHSLDIQKVLEKIRKDDG